MRRVDCGVKKYRKLTIGGIESKVFNLILLTGVLISLAFIAVIGYQSRMLAALKVETSTRQQESISQITDAVMDQVVQENIARITQLQATETDEVFQRLELRVRLVSAYVEKLFAEPENYAPAPYAPPRAELDGTLSVQATYAAGVDPDDPAVKARMGLVANASDLMLSLLNAYETDNICIGLEEGAMLSVNSLSGGWVWEDGTPVRFDPRGRYWYKAAQDAGELTFTDVEIDRATGDLCVTCTQPIYGPGGELVAVVSGDLFLDQMQQIVRDSAADGGFLAVVNQSGHVILSPEEEGVFQVQNSARASDLRESENSELAALVSDALRGNTDVRRLTIDGQSCYAVGAPMETVGWTLIAVFSEEAASQPTRMLRESYVEIEGEATALYRDKSAAAKQTIILILLCLMAVFCTAALILSKRIVRPLNDITRRISELREGDLEFRMDNAYRTGDEIQVLAESFAAISHKTLQYVDQVRQVTAEKERISTELALATRIQADMLPNIYPAFPDRRDFDIYAVMDPAKEVGGDFYDFFLIDDDHLCMVIADVSGKGVPAALFMMASRIILANNAKSGKSPAQILTETNATICANNREEMFVTVWLGILELSTGLLTAANAGHEYPVLKTPEGKFELYKDKHGFVIGGMDGVKYREYTLTLEPGAKLFVYTDGVPEATDDMDGLFGTERMLAALNSAPAASPEGVLKNMRKAVDEFVGGAEQFDDLTMLCLYYMGPDKEKGSAGGKK